MGKLGYRKVKEDKVQKRERRLRSWNNMGTAGKIFVVLGLLASPFILIFALLIIAYTIDTSVPYNFELVNKLDNPNGFNKKMLYSEIESIYEYEGYDNNKKVMMSAKKLHEQTGLQLYVVGRYMNPEYISYDQFEAECDAYIKENINDEYGVYLLFSEYESRAAEEDADKFLYVHGDMFILGSEAEKFFTSGVLETYIAAEKKVRYHSMEYYDSLEEFFMVMDYVIDRNMRPVKSLLLTLIKLSAHIVVVVVIVILIRKHNEKKRKRAVFESDIDDLVKEHEELYSKYDELNGVN